MENAMEPMSDEHQYHCSASYSRRNDDQDDRRKDGSEDNTRQSRPQFSGLI